MITTKEIIHRPESITLQWHITNRCNWRCKHCYQERYDGQEMNLRELKNILNQFLKILEKWNIPKSLAKIQITGGEPFLHSDLLPFLSHSFNSSSYFRWMIMSNGSLLTEEGAKALKLFGISTFQLSLEGAQKINDEIRGEGAFEKTIKSIELLDKIGVNVAISLTLTKKNQNEIEKLVKILSQFKMVKSLGVRRSVPIGTGSQLYEELLKPEELKATYKAIEKMNVGLAKKGQIFRIKIGCESGIFNDEISNPDIMPNDRRCTVAEGKILTIMPDGTVFPCRRLPIATGNIFEKSLEEIYFSVYENLRDQYLVAPECQKCVSFESCLGGAKCVTYAVTGKTSPDIQCWRQKT